MLVLYTYVRRKDVKIWGAAIMHCFGVDATTVVRSLFIFCGA